MNLLNVRFTERSARNERQFLENAVRDDDQSAEAWGRLAGMLASDYLNCWNGASETELKQAEDALQKAFALDDKNPMALHAAGLIHRARDRHTESRDAFRQAHTIDGTIACTFAQEAAQEINLGNWNAQVRSLLQHAIDIGPQDPSLGVFYWIMARGYFFEGNYSEAIRYLLLSIEKRPNLWFSRLYLVAAYYLTGNISQCFTALDDFRNANPGFDIGDVAKNESKGPNQNSFVSAGRDVFRKAVTEAWNQHPK